MVHKDLQTIIEGKNWVVQNSKNQRLIVDNYHALQKISESCERDPKTPMNIKNFFGHRDSEYAQQHQIEEADINAADVCFACIISVVSCAGIYYFVHR